MVWRDRCRSQSRAMRNASDEARWPEGFTLRPHTNHRPRGCDARRDLDSRLNCCQRMTGSDSAVEELLFSSGHASNDRWRHRDPKNIKCVDWQTTRLKRNELNGKYALAFANFEAPK